MDEKEVSGKLGANNGDGNSELEDQGRLKSKDTKVHQLGSFKFNLLKFTLFFYNKAWHYL